MATLSDFIVVDDVTDNLASKHNRLLGGNIRAEFVNTETITVTKELTDNDCQFQVITPSGADKIVELPLLATTNHFFVIFNSDTTYNITVKDSTGTTIYRVIKPSEWDWFVPVSGKDWQSLTLAVLKKIPSVGMMLNGKISVTVASNNLTLAIKTLAGADPSAGDPVWININGTIRTITAATSCTLNAGANWFNAGGAELATKEIDYFAYAVWDSNSSVVAIAPARIPYGSLVSDFSSTTTNEKYIGNYANFTTTDDVVVIGRFAATLSAGAGYTWTVPTFTNANLIQEPIFKTRWLTWTPTITGYSVNPTNVVYLYTLRDCDCIWELQENTAGTSNATTKTYTAPFTAKTLTNMIWGGFLAAPLDNGAYGANGFAQISSASNIINMFRPAIATWTASGSASVTQGNGRFAIG